MRRIGRGTEAGATLESPQGGWISTARARFDRLLGEHSVGATYKVGRTDPYAYGVWSLSAKPLLGGRFARGPWALAVGPFRLRAR